MEFKRHDIHLTPPEVQVAESKQEWHALTFENECDNPPVYHNISHNSRVLNKLQQTENF